VVQGMDVCAVVKNLDKGTSIFWIFSKTILDCI
jgi:hypothetical protein